MSLPILMYHNVGFQKSVLNIPDVIFRSQMEWLQQAGCEVVPFSEVITRLKSGYDLPHKGVCLSFDDGLAGVYQSAFPILQDFGFPSILFLVAGYCGKNNNWPGQPGSFSGLAMIDWEQAREMNKRGMTIGSHSFTHKRLDHLSEDDLDHELSRSQSTIHENLGQPVEWFAFPYGRYNLQVLRAVRSFYQGACTTHLSTVDIWSSPFELGRIDAFYVSNPSIFRLLHSRIFPVYLAIRRSLRRLGNLIFDRPWS